MYVHKTYVTTIFLTLFKVTKEEIYNFIATKRHVAKETASANTEAAKLNVFSCDNLERSGYLIERMKQFPKLSAAVLHDYKTNASRSGWTCNKVNNMFQLFFLPNTNLDKFF